MRKVLRRLETAGLVTQGVLSGARLAIETGNWSHKTTDITSLVNRYLDRAEVRLNPPKGEYVSWSFGDSS